MQTLPTSNIKLFTFICFIIFLFVIPPAVYAGNRNTTIQNETIRINPEIKIKRLSNGDVIATSKDPRGTLVNHQFKDFYADLLIAAYRKQKMQYIETTLRKKYYLSVEDFRHELKHAINVFSEWNIIVHEDQAVLH